MHRLGLVAGAAALGIGAPAADAANPPITVTNPLTGLMSTSCARVSGLELAVEPYSNPFTGLNASPVMP